MLSMLDIHVYNSSDVKVQVIVASASQLLLIHMFPQNIVSRTRGLEHNAIAIITVTFEPPFEWHSCPNRRQREVGKPKLVLLPDKESTNEHSDS